MYVQLFIWVFLTLGVPAKTRNPTLEKVNFSLKHNFIILVGRDPGTDMTFGGFAMKRFTGAKKPITLEFVKGTLLVIADQMVGTIADVIQENAELEAGGKTNILSKKELKKESHLEARKLRFKYTSLRYSWRAGLSNSLH